MPDDNRLTLAALRARNNLRLIALPKLQQLATMLKDNPEATALVEAVHDTTLHHTENLRLALKDRQHRPAGKAGNLPCWTRRA